MLFMPLWRSFAWQYQVHLKGLKWKSSVGLWTEASRVCKSSVLSCFYQQAKGGMSFWWSRSQNPAEKLLRLSGTNLGIVDYLSDFPGHLHPFCFSSTWPCWGWNSWSGALVTREGLILNLCWICFCDFNPHPTTLVIVNIHNDLPQGDNLSCLTVRNWN